VSVLERLADVFRDVLGDGTLSITAHTTSAEVPGWDSLNHLRLVAAIEKEFAVRFATPQIADMHEVSHILRLLAEHGIG
jgi:acyl carrier protein